MREEKGWTQRVSYHTEVNFWVIIHRHVNLLLCLSWTSVVRWWMIVRNYLHGLFDLFMTLVFETLTIAIFTSIDTFTGVIILRWGGWRPVVQRKLEATK